ncbi:hypothetical protein AA0117_g12948 [Alternaria alternata]|uniref:Sodium/calcium exchanger membrane region domain-containing protein n=1 Tax=Alternaria alternata TaxID=5599 RepID=A0A4Q4MVK0_ALTAL|nr:hypothetical protein AA0117_g12948 [Alternaria alternata]
MSTFHVLYFVLPAFVVVRWTTSSTQDIEFLDAYQVGLLVLTVLLPVYAVQTRGDDWCAGVALMLLYVVYAVCVW